MFLPQTKWGIALLAAAIPFAVFTHVRGQQVPGAPTLILDDTDTVLERPECGSEL